MVLWLYAKVFSAKFGAWRPLALQKQAIHESFLRENHIFAKFFFPRKFPAIRYAYNNPEERSAYGVYCDVV